MFILVVTSQPGQFADFLGALADKGVDTGLTYTAKAALVHAKLEPPALVVVDEMLPDASSFELIAALAKENAAIQTAVVSRLSPEAFCAASKGLCVLAALSPQLRAEDAYRLLTVLPPFVADHSPPSP